MVTESFIFGPCTHARDHLRDTRNEKNLELAIVSGKSFSVGGKSFTCGKNLQRGLKMEHFKICQKHKGLQSHNEIIVKEYEVKGGGGSQSTQ